MSRAARRPRVLARTFKLSSNELPFGPSPKAVTAYESAEPALGVYPEGTSRVLREAIAAHFKAAGGLHRLRQRLGRDPAPDRQLLCPARRRSDLQRARVLALQDRDAREQRDAGRGAGAQARVRRRCGAEARERAHADGVHRQSEQSDGHLSHRIRDAAAACGIAEDDAARDRCGLCRICAQERLRGGHRARRCVRTT